MDMLKRVIEDPRECKGEHRFFVANDAVQRENELATRGKVIIFLVCTACGEGKKIEFEVS